MTKLNIFFKVKILKNQMNKNLFKFLNIYIILLIIKKN